MPKYVMSDGRFATSYLPSCELNKFIQKKYSVGESHDYRYFLQKNADKIMEDMKKCDTTEKDCVLCPVCKEAIEYAPNK
jgi:hypothetical protein